MESDTTYSVPAFARNALLGSRMAPSKSLPCCARYFSCIWILGSIDRRLVTKGDDCHRDEPDPVPWQRNSCGFSIHNYFFAKALDQVRPGGIVAFVTSRYTMDSKNPDARKYLAQRAELLGAIRLPNNAFRANAGTDVVSDIIFLQKRDHPIDIEPDWVHLGLTSEGITLNSYFVDHPEMVLGEITTESTQYGKEECTVIPIPG